jgi:hypothetical protein
MKVELSGVKIDVSQAELRVVVEALEMYIEQMRVAISGKPDGGEAEAEKVKLAVDMRDVLRG